MVTVSHSRHMSLLHAFRRSTQPKQHTQRPLSLREKAVLNCLIVQLIWTSWAFGGIRLIPLYGVTILSLIGFLWLWIPLPRTSGLFRRENSSPPENLRRLLRFPLFWLGLLLIAYMGFQAYNTADRYVSLQNFFFLEPLAYLKWLPSSVDAPVEQMNTWRLMMMLGANWLAVCTLWVGLRRRHAMLCLLWVVVINATLVALIAMLQSMLQSDKLLWFFEKPLQQIWGPFLYTNHGAAFLNIGLIGVLGLLFHYLQRGRSFNTNTGLGLLLGIMAVILGSSVVMSYSRGGILILAAIGGLFLLLFLIMLLRFGNIGTQFLPGIIIALMLLSLSILLYSNVNKDLIEDDFADLRQSWAHIEDDYRYHLNQATWEMILDKKWLGWGAGSFRYYFADYQKRYPLLRDAKRDGQAITFYYAHNDGLQYLAEFGFWGGLLILLNLLYWPFTFFCSIWSCMYLLWD